MGLTRAEAISWAWIELGLWALKKLGLANFWSPAKTKVAPRKNRNGSRAHSLRAHARTGAPKGRRRSRLGAGRTAREDVADIPPWCHSPLEGFFRLQRSYAILMRPHTPQWSRDQCLDRLVHPRQDPASTRRSRLRPRGPPGLWRGRPVHRIRVARRDLGDRGRCGREPGPYQHRHPLRARRRRGDLERALEGLRRRGPMYVFIGRFTAFLRAV